MFSRVERVERVEVLGRIDMIDMIGHQAEAGSGRRKCRGREVFGCIPHGCGAYRESDSFAMWAVHHGVTVSITTVLISSDPFTLLEGSVK